MMNILIPMAGEGKRFVDEGYKVHKPAIPTIDRFSGDTFPMVICATHDLPGVLSNGSNVTYIDRTFHRIDGVEAVIKNYYSHAKFITLDHLTEGQACTCLMAKNIINNDDELLIAGCDNGMDIDIEKFNMAKLDVDCLVFTYRNHPAVLNNPNAYGWVQVDSEGNITSLSIKKSISEKPMNDHAIVATFWFKKGKYFVEAAEEMIRENDRINGEYYVDQVIKYILKMGYKAKVFEIDKYVGWGTPKDYENYMSTIAYWKEFVLQDD